MSFEGQTGVLFPILLPGVVVGSFTLLSVLRPESSDERVYWTKGPKHLDFWETAYKEYVLPFSFPFSVLLLSLLIF